MADRGKFENIDLAIRQAPPLERFDWLVVTDDDIAFAAGFLDDLLMVAEATSAVVAATGARLVVAHQLRGHQTALGLAGTRDQFRRDRSADVDQGGCVQTS